MLNPSQASPTTHVRVADAFHLATVRSPIQGDRLTPEAPGLVGHLTRKPARAATGTVTSGIVNAGPKLLSCTVFLLAASCSTPRPVAEPPNTDGSAATAHPGALPPAKPERPPGPDLGEILIGLTLVSPASPAVGIADDEICEREGYPESLPESAAAELEDARPGQPVVIVHDEGQTHAAVAAVGCLAPEEYSDSATILKLTEPAGSVSDKVPPGLRPYIPPYFAFVGVQPSPEAILGEPTPLKRSSDEDAATRAAITAAAERVAATHADRCLRDEEFDAAALPSRESIVEAAHRADVWQLPASSPTLWVVFYDPALTFGCVAGNEPDLVGQLIDVASNTPVFAVEANNSVELQWTTDLDGDGTHEALLDVQWMEDGGHEVRLLHHDGTGWDDMLLYASDSP